MTNKSMMRVWGMTLVGLTVCLLLLLIADNVDAPQIEPEPNVTKMVGTITTIPTTTTTTTTTISAPTTTVHTHPIRETVTPETFLTCIRHIESRGNYQAVSASGTFMGAYQFYQDGWNTFAAKVTPEHVGVPPHLAPDHIQDSVALAAYNELGTKPWNGACG